MAHPIENIMKTTMEEIKQMVDVNTVVGTPILTGTETMILPVSKVSVGFFSGGGEYGGAKPAKGPCPIARAVENWPWNRKKKDIPLRGHPLEA